MQSIFNTTDSEALIERFYKLTSDSPALWGKMNVSQMLAHVQEPMKIATGELKLKQGLVGFLFGRIAKNQFMKNRSFKQGLPTVKSFIIKGNPLFKTEREKIVAMVRKFTAAGPSVLTKEVHPFFGRMTVEEWDSLQYIHLDHHLKQFGV